MEFGEVLEIELLVGVGCVWGFIFYKLMEEMFIGELVEEMLVVVVCV